MTTSRFTTLGADAAPVVVVGGGITGLAAAWRLHQALGARSHRPPLMVLEQRASTGGALRSGVLTGADGAATPVDVGAEAVLARRPEALRLMTELGLDAERVNPDVTRSAIASRGAIHLMPSGTVMGVPGDPAALDGLLTPEELARVHREGHRTFAPTGSDVTVGAFVAERLGSAVVDRLVEPLLGGVYAGDAYRLSLRATLPALWPAARDGRSLLDSVADQLAATAAARTTQPVFAGLRGGVWRLADALHRQLVAGGTTVRTGASVQQLERRPGGGWTLRLGPAGRGEELQASAVVLALPAPATARLLGGVAPESAQLLADVQVASTALVSVLLDPGALDDVAAEPVSGVLVPPVEGRLVKAMTFSSRKWAWIREAAGGADVLRLSVGRAGQVAALQRPDAELARAALADAADLLHRPLQARDLTVTRWGGALPQYGVGHAELVDSVLAEVAEHPGLAVAGSVYGGVGVPACVASAELAAGRVLDHLG